MLLSTNLEIQLPTHPLQRYSWAPTQRYSYQHIHYNHTPGHQPRDTITNTSITIILLDTNLLEIQLPTHCSMNTKDHLYKMTKATLHIKKKPYIQSTVTSSVHQHMHIFCLQWMPADTHLCCLAVLPGPSCAPV